MYFNDVSIIIYVIIGILGLIVGKIVAWCNIRIPENKKVFSKEFFKVTSMCNFFKVISMVKIKGVELSLKNKFKSKKSKIC